MAVSHRDDDEQPRKGSAIWNARKLARHQDGVEFFAAALLFLASLAGSTLAGGGGASTWAAGSPNLAGAAGAFVSQLLLSYVQYVYALDGFRAWQYRFALYISATLTICGYLPLVVPALAAMLVGLYVPHVTAYILGSLILICAAVAADVYPERTLVER